MLRFDGRVALITGAGRGLGRAHALMLASRGCQVIVNDLGVKSTGAPSTVDPAADVVQEIEAAGGVALASRHDVVTQPREMIEAAVDRFGRLDIVVNNAGVFNDAPFGGASAQAWHASADVHFKGTVEVCRAAWPHLIKSGKGRIVNTTSSAMLGGPGVTSYGAAKGAIYGFTTNLAADGRRVGINVNAIMPSAWTRMTATMNDQTVLDLLREQFQPDRVAAFVAWLVHPSTDVWMQCFRVSGHGASRVIVTTTASTMVPETTPEAWAHAGSQLLSNEELFPLRSTLDSFARELKEADPDIDLSQTFAAGGNEVTIGKGDGLF
ncbi:MAG TPA: SDR family NAD(P)-dependent oxidoreductase [Steroidobacteraceae bacterium]|nr:SDR family NAD(P)-dependent oxidoreductase [Steroidobacteraceae bacterium]